MQIRVVDSKTSEDVELILTSADVTLREVLEHASRDMIGDSVTVDGRQIRTNELIAESGLVRGSIVTIGQSSQTRPLLNGTLCLWQAGGIDAGWHHQLTNGKHSLTAIAADQGATVDRRVALASLVVADGVVTIVPEANGITLNNMLVLEPTIWDQGYLLAAGRVFRLDAFVGSDALVARSANSHGLVPVTRPPRSLPAMEKASIAIPSVAAVTARDAKLPVVGMLAPLPVSGVMALMMGPRALVFGLMSPLMALGNYFEDKRQKKIAIRKREEQLQQAKVTLQSEIDQHAAHEREAFQTLVPDCAELYRRVSVRSSMLWERRLDHVDALTVLVGHGDRGPNVEFTRSNDAAMTTAEAMALAPTEPLAPVAISLTEQSGIGISGDDELTHAVGRSLVGQLCITHGPADVQLTVLTSHQWMNSWDSCKWLPHILGSDANPRVASDPERAYEIIKEITDDIRGTKTNRGSGTPLETKDPIHVIVVDDLSYVRGRDAALRTLISRTNDRVRFIVLAQQQSDIPSACSTIVNGQRLRSRTDSDDASRAPAIGTIEIPSRRSQLPSVVLTGCTEKAFGQISRGLGGLEDSEAGFNAGASLPSHVALQPMLGLRTPEAPDPNSNPNMVLLTTQAHSIAVAKKWATRQHRPHAVIGIGTDGPVTVRIVEDGPHALIAGTTGAGKSELLRTILASFAVGSSPQDLTFLLVDYKGGSAFDACAKLPHVVGLVTDLDEHLSARVLASLRAELRYREQRLRDMGAIDIDDAFRLSELNGIAEPLPRLIVVIDEFATLAAELTDFLPSLVDVAQRGRSLGVHMILATQRPAGVLDNKIRANTNLRIALRVADDGDSTDVIGSPIASSIDRRNAGRAYVRFGAGELTLFQSAYSTAPFKPTVGDATITIRPFALAAHHESKVKQTAEITPQASAPADKLITDLDLVVSACSRVFQASRKTRPRKPFLEPLPEVLRFGQLKRSDPTLSAPDPRSTAFGLYDLPDSQAQDLYNFDLSASGNLLMYGIVGSGTTTALLSIASALTRRFSPDELHIYAVDADSNSLAVLDNWAHVGAAVSIDDPSRVVRLIRGMLEKVDSRRRRASFEGVDTVRLSEPAVVLLLDNLGALRQRLEDVGELDNFMGPLEAITRDGSSLGVNVVITAKQDRAVPSNLASLFEQRLVFRLSDTSAYTSFGFKPREIPSLPPGRAIFMDAGAVLREVQIAIDEVLDGSADRWADKDYENGPEGVLGIPNEVGHDDLAFADYGPDEGLPARSWSIPVGLDLSTAVTTYLNLRPGENAVLMGPNRSGRSSLLGMIIKSVREQDSEAPIAVISTRPTGVRPDADANVWLITNEESIDGIVQRILDRQGRRLVIIDDADRLSGKELERLSQAKDDDLTIVAATRGDAMKAFNFWARNLTTSRTGLLLRPVAGDGDSLRVQMPTRLPRMDEWGAVCVDDGNVSYVKLLAYDER